MIQKNATPRKSKVLPGLELVIWVMFVTFSFIFSSILSSRNSFAGVYQCVDPQGNVEFRGSPCATSLDEQTFLPNQSVNTPTSAVSQLDSNSFGDSTGNYNNSKYKNDIETKTKKLALQQSKETRKKLQLEKQKEKAAAKEQRRKLHCEKTKEKIQLINSKLRKGAKAKSFNRLKEELQHFYKMEEKYCKPIQ
jgi:hypothetical protein